MANELSPTQITILESGMAADTFRVGQVGRAIGKMQDEGLIVPAHTKGEWSLTDKGRSAYQIHLAQQAAVTDQVYKQTESAINLDDPALKPGPFEMLNFTASVGDAAGLAVLANERMTRIKQLEKSLDDMGALADDLTQKIKTLESAAPTATTGINWYQNVIAPIIDLMVQYDGEEARVRVERDPGRIVSGVIGLRLALDKVEDIADERAALIEDRDSTIEALRRCITDLENKLINIQPKRADVFLAGQILDELCEMIPEVEEFRRAREDAVKAISSLKARR